MSNTYNTKASHECPACARVVSVSVARRQIEKHGPDEKRCGYCTRRPKPADRGPMNCELCGAVCKRNSAMQRYCADCSAIKTRERQLNWSRANPKQYDHETLRARYRKNKSVLHAKGAAASEQNRGRLPEPDPAYARYRAVSIPFSYDLSKNAIYGFSRGGHRFIRKDVAALREELQWRLAGEHGHWYAGPLWLTFHVEKSNARGDAINVVTTIADAIKEAIGVDDRWYGIARLDWSIVVTNPQVHIGIGQYVTEHHQACSYCGAIRPLTQFQRNRSAKTGYSRKCVEC